MAREKPVSKADLVDSVAEQTGLKKREVKSVIDTVLDKMAEQLKNSGKVTLTGFGTFEVRERQARTAVRSGTTERIQVAAGKFPAFKPGKTLKEQVK